MYRIRHQLLKSLSQTLTEGINELGEKYQAVQMLPEFQQKYPGQFKPEIISVRLYQTEKACYLETTIDEYKEKGIDTDIIETAAPYEEYSRVDFRIHRHSLSFISTGEDHLFKQERPVLENAADFIKEMDPYSLINCTELFTEKAAKEIDEKHKAKGSADDPMEPPVYVPGEMAFTGGSLPDLDGYHSEEDPEFPGTPLASLMIGDTLSSILLTQDDRQTGTNKPEISGNLPEFIEFRSQLNEDQERLTTLSIPNNRIKNIRIKTYEPPYDEYDLPRKYEYLIELTTGGKIHIEGVFFEGSEEGGWLPEYWYYEHKIKIE